MGQSTPHPLRIVVSDQATRNLLMKSRFQLHNLYLQVYFNFDRPMRKREKLVGAQGMPRKREERSHGGPDSTSLPVARPIHYPSLSPQPHRQCVKTQLGIAMFNAGSLMNTTDEHNNLASLSHIDVIGVTETWLHCELKYHEVILPGYVLLTSNSSTSPQNPLYTNVSIPQPTFV